MKGAKGEKRRQELLKIAYDLFVQKGYDETSIDEIIAKAHIAKGTYYYYFPSKEATLEAVIDIMINREIQKAEEVLNMKIPAAQKLVGVISSLRPELSESPITDTLKRSENTVMHERIYRRIISEAVPLVSQVVSEGIQEGVFDCDHIEERVRMILILSHHLFDENSFTQEEIEVFVDIVEKSLGAKKGALSFIRELIR